LANPATNSSLEGHFETNLSTSQQTKNRQTLGTPPKETPQQTPADVNFLNLKTIVKTLKSKIKKNSTPCKKAKLQIPPHKPDKNSLSQHYLPLEINHKICNMYLHSKIGQTMGRSPPATPCITLAFKT